jgi:hypothetical protein
VPNLHLLQQIGEVIERSGRVSDRKKRKCHLSDTTRWRGATLQPWSLGKFVPQCAHLRVARTASANANRATAIVFTRPFALQGFTFAGPVRFGDR